MSEERLDRIEGLISQLIQMVGENNKTVKNLEQRFEGMEQRFDGLEQRFETEKELNRLRHAELLKEIRNTNYEIDYLRNEYAKHDMELYVLKQKIS